MSPGESMRAAHRALARKAWKANKARAEELTALAAEWRRTRVLTAEQRQHARALAHGLRGSAGTFGHELASRAAEQLEQILTFVPDEASLDVVQELIDRVASALAREPELEF